MTHHSNFLTLSAALFQWRPKEVEAPQAKVVLSQLVLPAHGLFIVFRLLDIHNTEKQTMA